MSNNRAAQLAAFYAGTTAPQQQAAPAPTAPPQPPKAGSWQDYEARGVPVMSWPEAVRDQMLRDEAAGNLPPPVIAESDTARRLREEQQLYTSITTATDVFGTANDAPAKSIFVASDMSDYGSVLNGLSMEIHEANKEAGWWTDIKTGQTMLGKDEHGRDRRNVGELLCLVHSEISEAMEGYRKNLMDDKLPHRSMLEVELADAMIRIFDIAGAHGLDLGGAIVEKRSFNKTRPDHQIANRLGDQGKKF